LAFAILVFLSVFAGLPRGASGSKTPGGWSVNGDQEILADPVRPLIYQAYPSGDALLFLDAFTGNEISRLAVGLYPMSIDLSVDGSWLYAAASGSNQTTVVNVTSRTIARVIPLDFSPFSVAAGPNDRLYVSGAQDGIVRILNSTTGAVLDAFAPMNATLQWLLEASPDGAYILVHLLTNGQVRIAKYGVSGDRFVFLAEDNFDLGENFRQMAVDWEGGVAYLVSGTPYGIELVSLSNLTRLGWLPMWAYPAGVALMPDRNLVFGINRYFYGGDLWVFNTSTRAELNKVPIRPSPSGYTSEESLMVASSVAGTVLLWTEELMRVLTINPSLSPGHPAPDSEVPGYPGFYVTANMWRGLVEPQSNTTTISVDGTMLNAVYDAWYRDVRAPAPILPVGRHQVVAEIVWPGGSKSVTWSFTVTSPPPIPSLVILTSSPFRPGEPVEFDARNSSAALGKIVRFEWNFGDGSTSSGARATHTFAAPGVYRVSLIVTTDLNVSSYDARDILIEEAPTSLPAPVVGFILALSIAAPLAAALALVWLWKRRPRGPRTALSPNDERNDPRA
jgi:hypothetical protein